MWRHTGRWRGSRNLSGPCICYSAAVLDRQEIPQSRKWGHSGLICGIYKTHFQPNITYVSSTPQETVQFSNRRLLTLGPFIRGRIRRVSHKLHPLHCPYKRESTVSTRATRNIYQDVWILLLVWHDGIYMIYGIDRIYMIYKIYRILVQELWDLHDLWDL